MNDKISKEEAKNALEELIDICDAERDIIDEQVYVLRNFLEQCEEDDE